MTVDIIKAIAVSIYEEFGEDYAIYTESVEQGLQEPCFFVLCIDTSNTMFVGRHRRVENHICIQYFPADNDHTREECSEVAERLFSCLKLLKICEKSLRGTEMNYQITDGVMSFFVDYGAFIYTLENDEKMGDIKRKIKSKG